jgi:hypothetical protein
MPGIAEESLIALENHQPIYLLGGFGGCARDIVNELGLSGQSTVPVSTWPGREKFSAYNIGDLRNGLTEDENKALAITVHIDQAITLILRGLLRQSGPKSA